VLDRREVVEEYALACGLVDLLWQVWKITVLNSYWHLSANEKMIFSGIYCSI
jgi:hypothetical protein